MHRSRFFSPQRLCQPSNTFLHYYHLLLCPYSRWPIPSHRENVQTTQVWIWFTGTTRQQVCKLHRCALRVYISYCHYSCIASCTEYIAVAFWPRLTTANKIGFSCNFAFKCIESIAISFWTSCVLNIIHISRIYWSCQRNVKYQINDLLHLTTFSIT